MRKFKVLLSLVLVVIMLISGTAFGAVKDGITYTALGDSIAYGTGATELFGYTDMLNNHFGRIYGEGTFNKDAYDGVKSGDLLDLLKGDENDYAFLLPNIQENVMNSDVITVSIGGNDLLTPFRELLLGFLTDNYLDSTYQIDYEKFMEDFEEWEENPASQPQFYTLLDELEDELETIPTDFFENWSKIIIETKKLNGLKQAEIYVNTIYNPFVFSSNLHDFADPIIQGMNGIIVNGASVYGYKVVDVYTKFERYNNPKKLAVGDLSNFVEYIMSPVYTTPVPLHPTDKGYKFIFNLHKDLLE